VFRVGFRAFPVGSGCSGWGSGFYRHPDKNEYINNLRTQFLLLQLKLDFYVKSNEHQIEFTNFGSNFVLFGQFIVERYFKLGYSITQRIKGDATLSRGYVSPLYCKAL
jgi:hypothetical protein